MNEGPERLIEEVFRGRFEECLRHFWDRLRVCIPKGSRGSWDVKKPLADFCGVEIHSVERWMNGESPTGDRRIKLMCYLEAIGYRIIEVARMQKDRRGFAELIGFGVLTADEAARFVGYSKTSRLFPILQGNKEGTSSEKEQRMWDLWKEKRAQLEQKRKETIDLFIANSTLFSVLHPKKSPTLGVNKHLPAVSIMEGLLGLVTENFIEGLSEQDLTSLQSSATTVLELSARLSALGSKLVAVKAKKGVPDGEQ